MDTNVLVSALKGKGKPRELVRKLLNDHTVILSSQILGELTDVITRDKFISKGTQINRFLSILENQCKMVADNPCLKSSLKTQTTTLSSIQLTTKKQTTLSPEINIF